MTKGGQQHGCCTDRTTEQVELSRLDLQCQTRATIDAEAVRYAESIRNGVELPPGLVFRDTDGKLYLSSGFHRRLAYQAAGRSHAGTDPPEPVCGDSGGIEDNLKHVGVRLSVADRRQAAGQLLQESQTSPIGSSPNGSD